MSRGAVTRLRAQVAKLRAALPPLVAVIEPQGEDESAAAFEARKAGALRRTGGRRAFVVLVDRDGAA